MLRKFSAEKIKNLNKEEKLFLKKIQTYDIILYVILIVLFLALNKDKPHYNMLNSLGAMISCFIKLMEIYLGKWLKWNITLFRSYFSQYTSQYFYTKNIVFYCT